MTQPDDRGSPPIDEPARVYELSQPAPVARDSDSTHSAQVIDEVVVTEADDKYVAAAAKLLNKLINRSRELHRIYDDLIDRMGDVVQCKIRLNRAIEKEKQAWADLDGAQAQDKNHAPLPRQWAIAAFFLLPEWGACYLGAEAFGYGRVLTALIASLFLVILAGCEYWYDSATRQGGQGKKHKTAALGFLTAIIFGLGALRFYYSWITEGHSIALALLFAAILSVVTAVLVAIGIIALAHSESLHVYHVRQEHRSAQRNLHMAEEGLKNAEEDEQAAEVRFHRVFEKDLVQEAQQSGLDVARLRIALSEYVNELRKVIAKRIPVEEPVPTEVEPQNMR